MSRSRRKTPAYRRLSAELHAAIEEGSYADGEPLPTEVELCRRYGVSRHTVRQAFQQLVADGLVYRVPGRGTFATGFRGERYLRSIGTIEEVMSWPDTELKMLRPFEVIEDRKASERLRLLPQEKVGMLAVRRFYEGVPFVVTYVYLPPDIGERLTERDLLPEGSRTVIGNVSRLISRSITGASQEITAVAAPKDLADLIDCQPGEPILYVERTYFDGSGRPVEFAISHYNPRRYSYHLEMRRRP